MSIRLNSFVILFSRKLLEHFIISVDMQSIPGAFLVLSLLIPCLISSRSKGLSDCNWTQTHYYLVRKRTLNHLAKRLIEYIQSKGTIKRFIHTTQRFIELMSCDVSSVRNNKIYILKHSDRYLRTVHALRHRHR